MDAWCKPRGLAMGLYAFDGTWNFRDTKEAIDVVQTPQYGPDMAPRRETIETNVHRFMEYYGRSSTSYLQGVGTRLGPLGRIFGGAFGAGGRCRVRRMYYQLCERYYRCGDHEIDIVGFSRGAALAVHFTNVLNTHGIRNPSNRRHFAWWYYADLGWTFRHPKSGCDDVVKPEIHFVGLWDMVASFGIPFWPFRNRTFWPFRNNWRVWEIPKKVKYSFHAMALDEVRATFALIRPSNTTYEVWFRGAHSNIGGGYLDRGLSDIALAWMMEQYVYAMKKLGRQVPGDITTALRLLDPIECPTPDWIATNLETLEPNPNGVLGRPADLRRQAWRQVGPDDLVHHSVFHRDRNLVSDHALANRPLLRPVPSNVRPVDDPPLFYRTMSQWAKQMASDAFAQIPVQPRDWFMIGEHYVFRSDNWVAMGTAQGRADPQGRVAKADRHIFIEIAMAWILNGKSNNALPIPLPGEPTAERDELRANAEWLVKVLNLLKNFLPRLMLAGPVSN